MMKEDADEAWACHGDGTRFRKEVHRPDMRAAGRKDQGIVRRMGPGHALSTIHHIGTMASR